MYFQVQNVINLRNGLDRNVLLNKKASGGYQSKMVSRSDAFEVIGVSSATFVGLPQPNGLGIISLFQGVSKTYNVNIPHSTENTSALEAVDYFFSASCLICSSVP